MDIVDANARPKLHRPLEGSEGERAKVKARADNILAGGTDDDSVSDADNNGGRGHVLDESAKLHQPGSIQSG